MIKKLGFFTLLTIFLVTGLYANPSPLGIELSKTTLDALKKNYKIAKTESNDNKGYLSHYIDTKNIPMDSLSNLVVVTNENKVVEGVILVLNKSKFDEIYQTLSSKYEVLSKDIPFVGDKFVKLQDGDSNIQIISPHMGFTMQVIYVTKHLNNLSLERWKKEQQAKQEQTKNLL